MVSSQRKRVTFSEVKMPEILARMGMKILFFTVAIPLQRKGRLKK